MSASTPNPPKGLSLKANFSWTFIGNIFNAVSWFSMTIVLAKLGSPEHVGQFAIGLAITAPIFMFATLRLRDVQATDTNQEYQFGDYYALRLITTLVAILIVVGIIIVSGYERETALVILACAAAKSVEAISDAFYGMFMQNERMDRIAKSMMMKAPLTLIGLGLGFYLTGRVFWGVMGLAIARIVILLAYDFPNASTSLSRRRKSKGLDSSKQLPRPRWNVSTLAKLTWLTLPLGLVTMLLSFKANIPRYFIEAQFGAYQLGIYAALANFYKSASTITMALGRSASPRLARHYTTNNARSFRNLMLKLVGISVLLGCMGVLVAVVIGPEFLTLVYGPEYAMYGLFIMVMIAAGIDYISDMLQFGMTAAKYFKVQLPVYLLSTSTMAICSFLFIPSGGLDGAAIALVVTALVRLGGSAATVWHAERALHKQPIEPEEAEAELEPEESSQ